MAIRARLAPLAGSRPASIGNALLFNGTNARVTVGDSPSLDLTTAMTLEAWVYPTGGAGQWRDVIYKGPDDIYYLESHTSNGPPATGGTFANPLFGTAVPPLNTWSHLAATYDGTTLRLYVNGVQVASRAQTGPIATSSGALTIGGDALYGQHFSGRIDEVRIYGTALSASEIQTDMNTPIGTPGPDTQPPTAPTGLTATAVSPSQINLAWTASTDNVAVTGYRVERCQGAGCSNFVQVATPTATSFNDSGRAAATSYSYRVRAADAAGNLSGYSSVQSATTPAAPDTQPPTAPTRADGDGRLREPDQPRLDGLDRQRRRHRLPGRALPGRGLLELRPGGDADGDLVQRQRPGGGDELQLPRAGGGRGRQPERLLERAERDHAGGRFGARGGVCV